MSTLPRFVRPMLARPGQPFDSPDYLFEVKWDGMRALAFVDRDGQRIVSRHGNDLTEQFPELACLAKLPPGTVLDGELVVLRNGRPDLSLVQSRQQLAELDASFDRRPHVALDLPAAFSRDWPQHLLVDWVTSGHCSWQEENGFLDLRCEGQQIHDLRHPWLCDVSKPGEFGLVADFPGLNEPVESDRQSHQSGNPRDSARLKFSCRITTLDSMSTAGVLPEVDLLFETDHAASPTALSASVLIADA